MITTKATENDATVATIVFAMAELVGVGQGPSSVALPQVWTFTPSQVGRLLKCWRERTWPMDTESAQHTACCCFLRRMGAGWAASMALMAATIRRRLWVVLVGLCRLIMTLAGTYLGDCVSMKVAHDRDRHGAAVAHHQVLLCGLCGCNGT